MRHCEGLAILIPSDYHLVCEVIVDHGVVERGYHGRIRIEDVCLRPIDVAVTVRMVPVQTVRVIKLAEGRVCAFVIRPFPPEDPVFINILDHATRLLAMLTEIAGNFGHASAVEVLNVQAVTAVTGIDVESLDISYVHLVGGNAHTQDFTGGRAECYAFVCRTSPDIESIGARAEIDRNVRAVNDVPVERVVAGLPQNHVHTFAAVEDVIADAALDSIVAGLAVDLVVAAVAVEQILALIADDDVIAGASVDHIVLGAALDPVAV